MPGKLQKKMFHEMKQKDIFRQAQKYAFNYADNVLERNVYPTPDAIAGLDKFAEALPESSGNAAEVLEQLNQYGTPAGVAQTGGRYFGFVNGGVIPASLAVRWLSDFWDQNTALYVISPVAAKLEEVSESWLRELLGLPDKVVAGDFRRACHINTSALLYSNNNTTRLIVRQKTGKGKMKYQETRRFCRITKHLIKQVLL